MKLLTTLFLTLLFISTHAFELNEKARDMFNEITSKYNFSGPFYTFEYPANLLSGRCYKPNSRIPLGAGLAVNTFTLDDGPMGSNEQISIGYLSTDSKASAYDNMNFQDYTQSASWGLREFIYGGVFNLQTEEYHFNFGIDIYTRWIYAVGWAGESKQIQIACYFFKDNQ